MTTDPEEKKRSLSTECVVPEYGRMIRWLAYKCYKKVHGHVRGVYSVDDLYQIGVESVLRAVPMYNSDKASPSTYVYRVLTNRYLDFLRVESRRKELSSVVEWYHSIAPPPVVDPLNQVVAKETVVKRLARSRKALILR